MSGTGDEEDDSRKTAGSLLGGEGALSVRVGIGYISGWGDELTDSERVDRVLSTRGRWLNQWWALVRSRDIVERSYRGEPQNNIWAVHAVEVGCLASQWLEEHLLKDGHEDVRSYRTESIDLQDAHDCANTHKHAGRDPDKRVGRVLDYMQQEVGVTVSLVFAVRGAGKVQTRDALDVLNGCVESWREYLTSTMGREPPPPPEG